MLINKIFINIIKENNEYLKPHIISKIASLENIILKKSNDDIYISGLINIFLNIT
jgi:hypothetical protein